MQNYISRFKISQYGEGALMSKKAIEDSWAVYKQSIFAIAEKTFNEIIKPFCQKRQWGFLAGNGTWWIGPPDGECMYPENCPEDAEFLGIVDVLSAEVPGLRSNDLGSLMPDYRGSDK